MNPEEPGAFRLNLFCPLCTYRTKEEKSFLRHCVAEHIKERFYWCRECANHFKSPKELVAHFCEGNCTKIKSFDFRCEIGLGLEDHQNCNFVSKDPYKFRHHLETSHKQRQLISCAKCRKMFTIPSNFIVHVQSECTPIDTVRKEPSRKNPLAATKDKSKRTLRKTRQKLKQTLKRTYQTKAKSKQSSCNMSNEVGGPSGHSSSKANDTRDNSNRGSRGRRGRCDRKGASKFLCGLCPFSTKEDEVFITHCNSKHCKEHIYWCRGCGNTFISLIELVAHIKDKCAKIKSYNFRCGMENCKFSSKDQYRFRQHIKTGHKRDHLLPCSKCCKLFTMPSSLILHMQMDCRSTKSKLSLETSRGTTKGQSKLALAKGKSKLAPAKAKDKLKHTLTKTYKTRYNSKRSCSRIEEVGDKLTIEGRDKWKRSMREKSNQSVSEQSTFKKSDHSGVNIVESRGILEHASRSHKGAIKICCGLCPFSAKEDEVFIAHCNNEHNKEVTFWCRGCGDVFTSPIELVSHIKDDCPKVKSFDFRCGMKNCKFSSKDPYKFRHHIKVSHKRSVLIPCIKCHKLFTMQSILMLHMLKNCSDETARKKALSATKGKPTLALAKTRSKLKRSSSKTGKVGVDTHVKSERSTTIMDDPNPICAATTRGKSKLASRQTKDKLKRGCKTRTTTSVADKSGDRSGHSDDAQNQAGTSRATTDESRDQSKCPPYKIDTTSSLSKQSAKKTIDESNDSLRNKPTNNGNSDKSESSNNPKDKVDVRFYCGLCPFNTKDDKSFLSHCDKEHHQEHTYWCRGCGEFFNSPVKQVAHVRDSCTRIQKFAFKCGVENCNFSSKDPLKFRRHIVVGHRTLQLFPCKRCNLYFSLPSPLISHTQICINGRCP